MTNDIRPGAELALYIKEQTRQQVKIWPYQQVSQNWTPCVIRKSERMMFVATQPQQQQGKWNATESYRNWRSRKHDHLKFQIATFQAGKQHHEALDRDTENDQHEQQAENPKKRRDVRFYLEVCTRPNSR